MAERQVTHYVGDQCEGGHHFDNANREAALSKPACIERVRHGRGHFFSSEMLPCQRPAKWRVDGNGPLGALYSDVPMCSTHRRKYDRAGYRSWPISSNELRVSLEFRGTGGAL